AKPKRRGYERAQPATDNPCGHFIPSWKVGSQHIAQGRQPPPCIPAAEEAPPRPLPCARPLPARAPPERKHPSRRTVRAPSSPPCMPPAKPAVLAAIPPREDPQAKDLLLQARAHQAQLWPVKPAQNWQSAPIRSTWAA